MSDTFDHEDEAYSRMADGEGGGPRYTPPDLTTQADLIRSTEKAYLINISEGRDEWIPKSQIRNVSMIDEHIIKFTIPHWLAEKKGLN